MADGVGRQTELALRHLQSIVEAGGSSLENVMKTTVFLASMSEFEPMNAVYTTCTKTILACANITVFPNSPPARSAVAVSALPKSARVEIEAIVYAPDTNGDENGNNGRNNNSQS